MSDNEQPSQVNKSDNEPSGKEKIVNISVPSPLPQKNHLTLTQSQPPISVIPTVQEDANGKLTLNGHTFSPITISRIHSPLKAEEVVEAIGEHVKKMLRQRAIFSSSNTPMELVVWRGVIEVTWQAYGKKTDKLNIEAAMILSDEEGTPIIDVGSESGQETITLIHQDQSMAPDKVRELTNQPIPVHHTDRGKTRVVKLPSKHIK